MSNVIDATSMSLLGGAITLTASSGGSGTLTLGGTNPVLAGVHTLNVSNTLQVGGVGVATTTYVNSVVNGRSWLQSVRLCADANVVLSNAVENGDTLDGVTLATGDRVLLTAQTTTTEKGIWVVKASGAPDRAADLLGGADAASVAVFVQAGTYADKAFICTNNTGSAVVGTDNLVFTQFGSADVADGSITSAKFAAGAVNTDAIGAGQVTSAKIADGAIATGNLADGAVTALKIANGTITSAKILDGTIATDDLADGAVTSAKILDGTIATGDLADGAVTALKIADGTITGAKMAAGTVTVTQIANATITGAKIAAATVAAGNIVAGTIVNAQISASAGIVASKIAPGTFGAGNYVLVGDMSATTFTATSDQRKKRNIEEIDADKALESICKARGVTFEWEDSKAKCAGVIAQEIQEFAPELVKTDDQSFLSLNYDGLNGYLFASLKALNDRLEKLEKSPQKRKLANTMCECACACNQDGSSSPAKRPNV